MIAVITSGHRPDDERIYHREIHTLRKLNTPIVYFTRSHHDINLNDDGIAHYNFKGMPLSTFREKMIHELNRIKPSIIHLHEFELLPIAKWAKKKTKAYIIYDVHEYLRQMWDTYSSKPFPMKQLINCGLSWYEKHHLPYVDHVVFANPMVTGNPYPKHDGRITVLENYPFSHRISSRRGWPEQPVLIYHGLMSPDRGIYTLLQAVHDIKTQFPNIMLKLFGPISSTTFLNEIKTLRDSLKLGENVLLKQEMPHEKVWGELESSTIGVIPFLKTPLSVSNTPTKLFEYMASGCGLVASDLAPIRYSANENMSFFQPGNSNSLSAAIINLLTNPAQLNIQRKANILSIKGKYNWETIEHRLLSIYQKIL
ncbi:MAG: glycosyltransferase family 4 protein [Candidatus Marinimicrobia bacterium]|nr:glycosyltransferase family 4 protein [Candidatus Neomarinimicrobiota bacterium]